MLGDTLPPMSGSKLTEFLYMVLLSIISENDSPQRDIGLDGNNTSVVLPNKSGYFLFPLFYYEKFYIKFCLKVFCNDIKKLFLQSK